MTLPSVKQAFLLHFGISLIIFIALVAIMRLIWFPGDLFYMDGGLQGLKIIAPIDLVLGPALTLLFYRPWKKSLKFDMATIALVQIAALGYGVYTAYQQRPVALVFAENRFETLSLKEFNLASEELRKNNIQPVELSNFSDSLPVVVHAQPFEMGKEKMQYFADIMNGMPELRERSDRFRPISEARQEIAKYRVTSPADGTAIAASADGNGTVEIPASSGSNPGADSERAIELEKAEEIYPLKARFESGTIHFEAEGFNWIDIRRSDK